MSAIVFASALPKNDSFDDNWIEPESCVLPSPWDLKLDRASMPNSASQSKIGTKQKKKRKKIPDRRSKENKINIQKGLWTRTISKQYRIVTCKHEKKKKTTT